MMRILIITYSREVNPGTFLQAYGVQYAFRQFFPDAEIDLLKHKRLYKLSGVKTNTSMQAKKDWTWLKGRVFAIPRRLKYEWYYNTKFNFSKQEFDLFDYNQEEFKAFAETYDLIIVGSDTILIDLKKDDKYGLMWLLGVNNDKVLFAASAAPAKFSLTDDEIKMLNENFSTYKYLGVRDSVTEKMLSEKIGLGDIVKRQFDPTYLIPDSHFKLPFMINRKLKSIRRNKKIALVNFGMDFFGRKDLSEYLRKKGYYVISTLYNPWADSNIMTLSAFGWAALFKYIDVAITERFHDSVFALRNNKAVIAVDWAEKRFADDGSSKTSCLLESYGISRLHLICRSSKEMDSLYRMIDNVDNLFDENKVKFVNREIAASYQSQMRMIKSATFVGKIDNKLGGGYKCKVRTIPPIPWFLEQKKRIGDKKLRKIREPYISELKELIDKDTSIISSNCFAGRVMQDLGMQYNSPTLGLYIWYPDFIEFLSNLKYYLTEAKIEFVEHSKYPLGDERRKEWSHWYPIGVLGGKVEIQFLHYYSEEEAAEKWYRRASRVNWNKLLIIGMEQNLCTIDDIKTFDSLPYDKKFFFSSKELSGSKSNCFMPEFSEKGEVGDPYRKADIFYRELIKRLN